MLELKIEIFFGRKTSHLKRLAEQTGATQHITEKGLRSTQILSFFK